MAKKAHLHAVPETGDTPEIASVSQACSDGSKLDVLVATQRVVARAIDNPDTSARDLAALTRRLSEINKEIENLRTAQSAAAEAAKKAAMAHDQPFSVAAI